jgi:hypothetical protein
VDQKKKMGRRHSGPLHWAEIAKNEPKMGQKWEKFCVKDEKHEKREKQY